MKFLDGIEAGSKVQRSAGSSQPQIYGGGEIQVEDAK